MGVCGDGGIHVLPRKVTRKRAGHKDSDHYASPFPKAFLDAHVRFSGYPYMAFHGLLSQGLVFYSVLVLWGATRTGETSSWRNLCFKSYKTGFVGRV